MARVYTDLSGVKTIEGESFSIRKIESLPVGYERLTKVYKIQSFFVLAKLEVLNQDSASKLLIQVGNQYETIYSVWSGTVFNGGMRSVVTTPNLDSFFGIVGHLAVSHRQEHDRSRHLGREQTGLHHAPNRFWRGDVSQLRGW
jgi:hypothetical protein